MTAKKEINESEGKISVTFDAPNSEALNYVDWTLKVVDVND